MSESTDSRRRLWLPALAALGVLTVSGIVAVAVVRDVGADTRPPFLLESTTTRPPARAEDGRLHVAGSGSCVPLARMLAGAARRELGVVPEVHASIGSSGGLRALQDGAIELALVSRPLSSEELAAGLVYTPFARIPVVVAAALEVPDDTVTFADLEAIFGGERTQWSDGSNLVVLLRESGDSSHRVVEAMDGALQDAMARGRSSGSFRVLYHDDAMEVALANTRGAIGLHGNGVEASLAGFRALTFEGIAPTAANVESGRYPFVKELAFVTQGEPRGDAKAFVDFVLSPSGRALLRARNAVPPASDVAEGEEG